MKIPKKYHHIAREESVDVDPDGTLFLWLNYGYTFDRNEKVHCRGYDTWKELVADLPYVEECDCDSCKEHVQGTVVK